MVVVFTTQRCHEFNGSAIEFSKVLRLQNHRLFRFQNYLHLFPIISFVPHNSKNYFLLHFIVFIWGWTAILGKVITLPADKLVWLRLPIAVSGIVFYLLLSKKPIYASPKNILKYLAVGLIVALHWICFYTAIKESNVSVTLACFSTGSLCTAFIEPLF